MIAVRICVIFFLNFFSALEISPNPFRSKFATKLVGYDSVSVARPRERREIA